MRCMGGLTIPNSRLEAVVTDPTLMRTFEEVSPDYPARVFVYGTLQPGGYYWLSHCQGRVRQVCPARVRGTLYDLHVGYPGLRLEGAGWVKGCLLEVPKSEDFARIDHLEGYDPARPDGENEYLRRRVRCFDDACGPLGPVWAYEVSAAALARYSGTPMESGVWPPEVPGVSRR